MAKPLWSRRGFLIAGGAVGAIAGGGLAVGAGYLGSLDLDGLDSAVGADGRVALNAWIAIDGDGTIRLTVPVAEIGQGSHTGCAMLIAEELRLDLARHPIVVHHPEEELPAFTNWALALDRPPETADGLLWWVPKRVLAAMPFMVTGGSTGIVNHWHTLRVAGATARQMLVEAAADHWGTSPEHCEAEDCAIIDRLSGKRMPFADLVLAAAQARPDTPPPLTPRSAFTVIGKPAPRVDLLAKVTGRAIFGTDVKLPDMLHAAVRHCRLIGGRIVSYDAGAAEARAKVEQVIDLGHAVAVVARDSHWEARRALELITIEETGPEPPISSAAIRMEMAVLLEADAAHVATTRGDPAGVLADARGTIGATYAFPFMTHACMEPMSCTARYQDGAMTLWCGTQSPVMTRWGAGRSPADIDRIQVNTTYAGGGFGRRTESLIATEAATLAARFPGRPVRLIGSREDDIQAGIYRAGSLNRLEAALDDHGAPVALRHRIVTASLGFGFGERNLPFGGDDPATDANGTEGAVDLAYAIPAFQVDLVGHELPVPIGYWRANAHVNNAFASESFLDECALATGADPLALRQGLLQGQPRHLEVLATAAAAADWHMPPGPGRGRGLALHQSFGSIAAVVIEVTVDAAGALTVDRAVVVLDCGVAVNPDSIAAQATGSVAWGLSAALAGTISFADGRVRQSNFHDYRLPTLTQMPVVETHIIEGAERPGGVGEPMVPPVAPALVNAIAMATGVRIRELPLPAVIALG